MIQNNKTQNYIYSIIRFITFFFFFMDTKLVAQGDGNFNAVLYLNSNREVLWERLKRLVQPNLKTILGKLFFNLKFGFIIKKKQFFKNLLSKYVIF